MNQAMPVVGQAAGMDELTQLLAAQQQAQAPVGNAPVPQLVQQHSPLQIVNPEALQQLHAVPAPAQMNTLTRTPSKQELTLNQVQALLNQIFPPSAVAKVMHFIDNLYSPAAKALLAAAPGPNQQMPQGADLIKLFQSPYPTVAGPNATQHEQNEAASNAAIERMMAPIINQATIPQVAPALTQPLQTQAPVVTAPQYQVAA